MFEDYFLEEFGKETLVSDAGFAMYEINGEMSELFVSDFYIKPEFRKTIENKKLFTRLKEIAAEKELKFITGIVSFGVKDNAVSTRVLKMYLALGFKVLQVKDKQIVLIMEV
jgi:hypothetical protein